MTSKYIHTLDTALIMAADTIAGYVLGLLDGLSSSRRLTPWTATSRRAALDRFLTKAVGETGARLKGRPPSGLTSGQSPASPPHGATYWLVSAANSVYISRYKMEAAMGNAARREQSRTTARA